MVEGTFSPAHRFGGWPKIGTLASWSLLRPKKLDQIPVNSKGMTLRCSEHLLALVSA